MKSVSAFLFLVLGISLALGQDEPGAIWMPSPHHFTGRNGHAANWLIIHGTAGGSSAENIGAWFQNPDSQVAAHYTVGQDGHVVQSVLEKNSAWGNGRIESGADSWWNPSINPNYQTISIEHVKPSTDNSDLITEAQKTASFILVRDIINRNPGIRKGWANSAGGITGHFSISPISRERCPGPYPFEELFVFLNEGGSDKCYGTVTATSGLLIRSQPNTQGTVVGSLSYGQNVELLGRTTGESVQGNTGWFEVGGGYAAGYYLHLSSGGPSWCY